MTWTKYIFPTIVCGALIIAAIIDLQPEENQNSQFTPNIFLSTLPVQDTVYTLSDKYIEISLNIQRAILVYKNGERDTFKISSGNPNIPEGISTPTGIFTVQNKSALAISKQFKDAKLYNWVGINGNVGIHGLEGNSYYGTLGVRPVSHGCMRISRENGEKLMKAVKVGVPAIIHNGFPARVIAFADSNSMDFNNDYRLVKRGVEQEAYMKQRMKMLCSGYFYYINDRKVFLDGSTILRGAKIESGSFKDVSSRQKAPIFGLNVRKPFAIDAANYGFKVSIPDSFDVIYGNYDIPAKKNSDTNDVAVPINALK